MSQVLGAVVLVPLAGAVLTVVVPARVATAVAGVTSAITALATGALVHAVATGGPLRLALAGWDAPLGIELRADGLSAALLAMTAVVGVVVTAFAACAPAARGQGWFWPLWLALWSALAAVYVSGDLFNLYVCLELMGLAAVGLVALGGRASWSPALRYLFVAVLGSLAYLVAVGLVYGETGALDLRLVAERLPAGPVAVAALALVAVAMALKTALFPLHAWLPPAHSAAPAAVSPVLSALVVKASLYVLVRLWFDVFSGVVTVGAGQLLGALGSVAAVWGTVMALRQERLKGVVAYSTVAQVGYLFLVFPLASTGLEALGGERGDEDAVQGWTGALLLALGHGVAKAAMFTAAGALVLAHGTDRLTDLRGAAARMPMSVLAFAMAAVSLAGLPPSTGFVGKWQLIQSSLGTGQWWWAVVLLGGGLLTTAYAARVLRLLAADEPFTGSGPAPRQRVSRLTESAALVLAVLAIALGFRSVEVLRLLEVGATVGGL